jgi:hypothetical protein
MTLVGKMLIKGVLLARRLSGVFMMPVARTWCDLPRIAKGPQSVRARDPLIHALSSSPLFTGVCRSTGEYL